MLDYVPLIMTTLLFGLLVTYIVVYVNYNEAKKKGDQIKEKKLHKIVTRLAIFITPDNWSYFFFN